MRIPKRELKEDLSHARESLEWTLRMGMLRRHRAAEKAVKTLYQALGIEVWGYSISRTLDQLPKHYRPPPDLIVKVKGLDRHYLPTRYPNFHPEGAPLDYCTEEDASRTVGHAEEVIEFCERKVL